jgi:hypothetical protein
MRLLSESLGTEFAIDVDQHTMRCLSLIGTSIALSAVDPPPGMHRVRNNAGSVARLITIEREHQWDSRPQPDLLLSIIRQGDTLICHSMDRMGRNLHNLRKLVLELTGRGVHVVFLKESLSFTGEDSPMANIL